MKPIYYMLKYLKSCDCCHFFPTIEQLLTKTSRLNKSFANSTENLVLTGSILVSYCVRLSHAITCLFSKYFQIQHIFAQILKLYFFTFVYIYIYIYIYFALFLKLHACNCILEKILIEHLYLNPQKDGNLLRMIFYCNRSRFPKVPIDIMTLIQYKRDAAQFHTAKN